MTPQPPDESQVEYLDDGSRTGARIAPWVAIATLMVTVVVMLTLALVRPPPMVRADRIVDIYRPALVTSGGEWTDPERIPADTFGTWNCIGRLSQLFGATEILVRARASRNAAVYTAAFADARAAQAAFDEIDRVFSGCVQESYRWTRGATHREPDPARYLQFEVESTTGSPGWLRRDLLVVQRANTLAVFVVHRPLAAADVAKAYAARVDGLARRS